MALLRVGFDILRPCPFGQNNGLYAAGRVALDAVVAEKADQSGKSSSDRSVFPFGLGDGSGHSLVGTVPRRYARSIVCSRSARPRAYRQSRGLVLSEQTHLAIESDLYLSAMEHLADSS